MLEGLSCTCMLHTVRVKKKLTKVGYGRVAVGYEKVAKGTEGYGRVGLGY